MRYVIFKDVDDVDEYKEIGYLSYPGILVLSHFPTPDTSQS